MSAARTRDQTIGPLWLEYSDYASRLLLNAPPPYLDSSAYISWERNAQRLLNSDVIALPVGEITAAWLGGESELRRTLAGSKRRTAALRLLLQQERLRAHLLQLMTALRFNFPAKQLALVCPSPAKWVWDARHQGGMVEPPHIPEEMADVESASLYMADFLREFRSTGLDLLLLEESRRSAPEPIEVSGYQSVFNIGAGYGWRMGLYLGERTVPGAPKEISFAISCKPLPGLIFGQELSDLFWNTGVVPERPHDGFRFTRIPPDIRPELTLERLAGLR